MSYTHKAMDLLPNDYTPGLHNGSLGLAICLLLNWINWRLTPSSIPIIFSCIVSGLAIVYYCLAISEKWQLRKQRHAVKPQIKPRAKHNHVSNTENETK